MKLFNIQQTTFDNFDDTIKSYLSKALGSNGNQFSKTNIFSIIFDGIKGVMQNAMFYIEDALTEQNIKTAFRKQSVYSLAKTSGYDPYYGAAAVGTIFASYTVNNGLVSGASKIYINDGTVIRNSITGVNYVISIPTGHYVVDLANPITKHQFKIVQGSWNTAQFSATGEALEAFHITAGAMYDRDYLTVTVDGKQYTQAACLYDMKPGGNEYVVSTGYDNTFDIIFGNDNFGTQLKNGQTVIVKYITHLGESGNIYKNAEPLFKFASTCYDSFGNDVNPNDYIKLSMDSQISGGTNSDTIENVKMMVGYNSRSLVIASPENFKLFLSRFSFIGHNNIWTNPNSLNVIISCLANYKHQLNNYSDYLNIKDSDILLSEEQKSMIIDTFANSNKTFAGINIKFMDPKIYKYAAICYIKIDSPYNKESVKESVKEILSNMFVNMDDNVLFIPKSDVIKTVLDNNSSIVSFDISFISESNETAYRNGYYYKYELRHINNSEEYMPVKYMYDSSKALGLDDYGNIVVDTEMDVPLLHGGFKYYPDKSKQYSIGETEDILMEDAIQFFFI